MQKKSIADLAYNILEENHRPMHYRKITEKVMKIKEIRAENPHHDVNALMGSDQRFIRYQRGIWGLVKWKYREAHLPYNLTSYCLRNGTIFLTSYLKPYFGWSRDNRDIEIIFVDDDGEEIICLVNYRQKLIFGLKEWYHKKKLGVNDTIFIGLLDENKKKYFIIAEKDIKADTEKDIANDIYQLLQEEGKPLTPDQIYAAIIRQDPHQQGLFSDYIQNILKNDTRFTKIQKDRWGLVSWMNKAEQFHINLKQAQNIDDFQLLLKKCFDFLGYETDFNQQQKLLTAQAALDYKSYSLLITGLPANYNKDMINKINWLAISERKENIKADSVIIFSERFYIKDLVDRANEEGVQLFELAILNKIVKEHQYIPFSLFELRIAFSPMHHPKTNSDKLMEIRNKQMEEWALTREIINILQVASKKNTYMDINLLIKELNIISNSCNENKKADHAQVKKIVDQLNQEPWKLVEHSESGNIILAYPKPIANRKVYSFFRFMMNKELYEDLDIYDNGVN